MKLMTLGCTREEMIGEPIWGFVEDREQSEEEVKAKLAGHKKQNKVDPKSLKLVPSLSSFFLSSSHRSRILS